MSNKFSKCGRKWGSYTSWDDAWEAAYRANQTKDIRKQGVPLEPYDRDSPCDVCSTPGHPVWHLRKKKGWFHRRFWGQEEDWSEWDY